MVAAPLSDSELASRADLVVEARVFYRSNGKAAISLKRITKGTPRLRKVGWLSWLGLRRTIVVAYRSMPPEPMLGDWWNEDAFSPGNRVRAYLVWDDRAECYEAVWWNGVDILR
jgi:hypothetical protein